MRKNIALVDDDRNILTSVSMLLEAEGFQIKTYNDAIEKMCDTNGWKYLNSYEDLCDPDTGYAVSGYMSSDGIHLSGAGLAALFNY